MPAQPQALLTVPGEQGKFWEMHDLLYDNQQDLGEESYKSHAQSLGLDIAAWNSCRTSPRPNEKFRRDIKTAAKAGIMGTPRAYVNGRLVSGAGSTKIIEYYIIKAMEEAESVEQAGGDAVAEQAAPSDPNKAPVMVKANTSKGDFYIDAFEGSISTDGKAVSQPGVLPAKRAGSTPRLRARKPESASVPKRNGSVPARKARHRQQQQRILRRR